MILQVQRMDEPGFPTALQGHGGRSCMEYVMENLHVWIRPVLRMQCAKGEHRMVSPDTQRLYDQ